MRRPTTVITYHAVGECPRDEDPHDLFIPTAMFEEQMAFLAETRTVVGLDALLSGKVRSRKPVVAITFDDGYVNNLEVAGPILDRYSFSATIFVPTKYLGGTNSWLDPSPCGFEIMNERQLHACRDMNLTLESHGHAHIDMSTASPDEIRTDIQTSLEILEGVLGRRPSLLAYPFGFFSDAARKTAREVGLREAFSIDVPDAGSFARERVFISPRDGMKTFAVKTTGYFRILRRSLPGRLAANIVRPFRDASARG